MLQTFFGKKCLFLHKNSIAVYIVQEKQFKYQKWIDKLVKEGCQLPPLYAPNNIQACRFVFSSDGHPNHIPQYVTQPKRLLQDVAKGRGNTSLFALSCFATVPQAEFFYANLRKAFKNAVTSIGDALAEGVLTNEDGLKTADGTNGHFDFYEYENCDLNITFKITKIL